MRPRAPLAVAWLLLIAAVVGAHDGALCQPHFIEAQYLIKGGGALGLAFADTLVSEDPTATVAIVDREARPGGHWVHAYDFVKLHQSASFYGVASRPLEPAPGAFEHLSSKAELLAYYEAVVADLVATGRVRYFPLHEAAGRTFRSLVTGAAYEVSNATTVVDATYLGVEVPSVSDARRRYAVGDGVDLVAINDLPRAAAATARSHYCVVGGGKTGMDAVLWLLDAGVAPADVSWIVPNDSWILVREAVTPPYLQGQGFRSREFLAVMDLVQPANLTHDALVATFEAAGALHRLDAAVEPVKYRSAVASRAEMASLRRVRDGVVRLGRLKRLAAVAGGGVRAALERGDVDFLPRTLFVDCSADGVPPRPRVPVFDGKMITLQQIGFQLTTSAAAIAFVEARGGSNAAKNHLAAAIPSPALARRDLARHGFSDDRTFERWRRDPEAYRWLGRCRLFRRNHGIGYVATFRELMRRPSLALRLPSLREPFAAALRRVCVAEGGGC